MSYKKRNTNKQLYATVKVLNLNHGTGITTHLSKSIDRCFDVIFSIWCFDNRFKGKMLKQPKARIIVILEKTSQF